MMETDKASKAKGLAWLAGGIAIAMIFGFGISPFVRAVPWRWEQKTAKFLGSTSTLDACRGSAKQQALLDKLVTRLYPLDRGDRAFSIQVQIVDKPEINAFAELGGKISINRGLLEKAESPEEVAGVLAHEITHVSRRHVLEGFVVHVLTIGGLQMLTGSTSSGKWTHYFLRMGFSRTQETEADQGALARLQKAHVDNRGMAQFFQRLKELSFFPDFLSDHPSDASRADLAKTYANDNTAPIMTPEEWNALKGYCQ